jgi:DNA ligase-1
MKAPSNGASLEELQNMKYPIACSAKLDGIRGVISPDGVLSNSLKPLGNQFMQRELSDPILIGLDGELVVGLPHKGMNDPDDDVFNRTSGAIRRSSGEPDFKFYVFDNFMLDFFLQVQLSYEERWLNCNRRGALAPHLQNHPRVVVLEQRICHSWQEAIQFENELIEMGYEGMMPRTLCGHYKEGRATAKEGLILKRKPLEQSEGVIVGVFEQMQNNNEKATNEMGNSFRTSHKENKVGKGTLGGVILKDPRWEDTFNCGTIIGGTKEWRQEMWDNPEKLMGKLMTYVYQGYGSIDKPRQPRGKAELRDPSDMTDY